MTKLMEGVRVVEVAIYAFVPAAGAALADWGADVIKVEHPETGDPVRALSAYGTAPGDGGVTMLWEAFNRGKRSVGIDIASEQGLEVLMQLIDQADVFLTNFMQPTCRRLGIDAETVLARNPRIIYARGTGQGPVGPDADKGGFDGLSYWSRPGVGTAAIPPGYKYPVMLPGPAFGDVQSGMNMAGGIAAALFRREKTGQGGIIDVSLYGSGLWAMQASIAGSYVSGRDNIVQLDRMRPANPIANIYGSMDGKFFVLGMLEADRYWPAFTAAFGRADLAEDPRFISMVLRAQNCEECVQVLDEIFAELTMAEIEGRLNSQEGPWASVNLPGDAIIDEQAILNGYMQMVKHESGAQMPMIPVPALADCDIPALTRAPQHCEHTDEVLGGAGLSEEAIIDLRIAGAVG